MSRTHGGPAAQSSAAASPKPAKPLARARIPRSAAQRRQRLLTALEARLEALTEGLQDAQVSDKGIDMMKEIKELHAMLEALQQAENNPEGSTAQPPRVIVVWGQEAPRPEPRPTDGADT